MSLIAGGIAVVAWLGVLLVPWRPWSTAERIAPRVPAAGAEDDLSDVTVLIPARNEAAHIGTTLAGVASQGGSLRVVVVDDQSVDATAAIAKGAAQVHPGLRIEVVDGAPLPPGWGGKLWALEQGLARVDRAWVLLLDADIEIGPGLLAALLQKARQEGRALVSIMADLRCVSVWERLLVPPFVYFFKLIYPFARVNDPASRIAAAAGGCILVRTDALRSAGAFESMRDALIDDCTLAGLVKRGGHRIWLGLSHAVRSQRRYDRFGVFARMITRTAFTQLRYSGLLLVTVTALMVLVFAGPFLIAVNHPDAVGVSVSVAGLIAMYGGFLATIRWYSLPAIWVLALPVAAALYLGMTWASAIAYWRGVRAKWKGRAYASD